MAVNFPKTTFKDNQAPAIDATFLNNLQDNIKTNLTDLDTKISTLENNENTSQVIPDRYSVAETKVEGATWVDGKQIYRRVIAKNNIENASRCDLYTDINIESLIKAEGFITYNNKARLA